MSPWIPDWHLRARCRGAETALFYDHPGEKTPEKTAREEEAKALCAACPVRPECLAWALGRPERYGILGGQTEDERAKARKDEQRRASRERVPA
jgi:WhiB family transcriptional regulator, redox-sensing transcriptional regulator